LQIKLFLFFLALSIVIPIGVNDAFGIDATVTLEKSLTPAEMIIAIEYVINNS